jgi:hypothetical protein
MPFFSRKPTSSVRKKKQGRLSLLVCAAICICVAIVVFISIFTPIPGFTNLSQKNKEDIIAGGFGLACLFGVFYGMSIMG